MHLALCLEPSNEVRPSPEPSLKEIEEAPQPTSTGLTSPSVGEGNSVIPQKKTYYAIDEDYEEILKSHLEGKANPFEGRFRAAATLAPRGKLTQCYIKRDKDFLGGHSSYFLFLEDFNGQRPQFILAARKRKSTKQSNFVISTDKEDLNRDSKSW